MNSSGPTWQLSRVTRDASIKVWCNVGLRWETRAAARSQGIAEPNGVARKLEGKSRRVRLVPILC